MERLRDPPQKPTDVRTLRPATTRIFPTAALPLGRPLDNHLRRPPLAPFAITLSCSPRDPRQKRKHNSVRINVNSRLFQPQPSRLRDNLPRNAICGACVAVEEDYVADSSSGSL